MFSLAFSIQNDSSTTHATNVSHNSATAEAMITLLSKEVAAQEQTYKNAQLEKITAEAEIKKLQRKLEKLSQNVTSPRTLLSDSAREHIEDEKEKINTQITASQKTLRLSQLSIDTYEDKKEKFDRLFNLLYPPSLPKPSEVDPKSLSLVQELWTLLKSAAHRPPLSSSYDPILQTITLPNDLSWPVGVSESTLFVRQSQEKMMKDVMEQYEKYRRLGNTSLTACYGCIIKGTPGIGE